MEIYKSAHRHDVRDNDMLHAVDNSLLVDDLGEDLIDGSSLDLTAQGTFWKSSCSSPMEGPK
ncbi:MAG: hypothetical protein R2704_03315 [Microthrixaceae bacterium]